MPRTIPPSLPRLARLLAGVGENLRNARLRRKLTAEAVAERAGINRNTLHRVERGDPAVALGIYARVMQVLRLEADLALIAKDDELGRKLQDLKLSSPKRAPKQPRARSSRVDQPSADAGPPTASGNVVGSKGKSDGSL